MEIIKKIEIKSYEADHLLSKKMNNGGRLFIAAITQLSRIYYLARQELLYPYIALIKLYGEMDKAKCTMEKLIRDFEKVLKGFDKDGTLLVSRIRSTHQIRIDNPLAGELTSLIQLFDHLSCLLWIANNLNLFREYRFRYFKAVDQNSKRILNILRLIFALGKGKDTEVTITHYLNGDPAYLTLKDTLGEVKPALLYSALNLELLPRFSTQKRNIIIFRLKEMAGIKTAKRKS